MRAAQYCSVAGDVAQHTALQLAAAAHCSNLVAVGVAAARLCCVLTAAFRHSPTIERAVVENPLGPLRWARAGTELQQKVTNGERPVLAVKGARVGDFNGKNVSSISTSQVLIDQNIPECVHLRKW